MVLIVFLSSFALCVANDLNISVMLGDEELGMQDTILTKLHYYDIFEIRNLDYSGAKTNATVYYYVLDSQNNKIIENTTIIKNFARTKSADTGDIYISNEGSYVLCAEIVNSTAADTNNLNNKDCKNFIAIDSTHISCDMTIDIVAKDVYYSNETVDFNFVLSNEEYFPEVEYWVVDPYDYLVQDKVGIDYDFDGSLLLSNIGEVYDYSNFIIKANITNPWCNDSNLDDNYAEKLITVKSTSYYSFTPTQIRPYISTSIGANDTVSFGRTFFVDIEAWSGSTSGKIKLWIEDNASKKATENTVEVGIPKMTLVNSLKLPIEIKDNCDRKLKEGNYTMVIEGFGFKDSMPVYIYGFNTKLCKDDNSQQESTVSIDKIYYKSGDHARLGEHVRADVLVYKGNTGKSSISAYIIDDLGAKISVYGSDFSLKTKYQDYKLNIPVLLKPDCDRDTSDRKYYFVVDGLGINEKQQIDVSGVLSTFCETHDAAEKKAKSSAKKGTFSSRIVSFPQKIKPGEIFYTEVELDNNKGEDISVDLWGYVAQGRKVFSDKEANKKSVLVQDGEIANVRLAVALDDAADPGEYELKVGVDRSDIKTDSTLTESLLVENAEQNNACVMYQEFGASTDTSKDSEEKITAYAVKSAYKYDADIDSVKENTIVYESSTVKAGKLLPYLIITALLVLCIVLVVWRV